MNGSWCESFGWFENFVPEAAAKKIWRICVQYLSLLCRKLLWSQPGLQKLMLDLEEAEPVLEC